MAPELTNADLLARGPFRLRSDACMRRFSRLLTACSIAYGRPILARSKAANEALRKNPSDPARLREVIDAANALAEHAQHHDLNSKATDAEWPDWVARYLPLADSDEVKEMLARWEIQDREQWRDRESERRRSLEQLLRKSDVPS